MTSILDEGLDELAVSHPRRLAAAAGGQRRHRLGFLAVPAVAAVRDLGSASRWRWKRRPGSRRCARRCGKPVGWPRGSGTRRPGGVGDRLGDAGRSRLVLRRRRGRALRHRAVALGDLLLADQRLPDAARLRDGRGDPRDRGARDRRPRATCARPAPCPFRDPAGAGARVRRPGRRADAEGQAGADAHPGRTAPQRCALPDAGRQRHRRDLAEPTSTASGSTCRPRSRRRSAIRSTISTACRCTPTSIPRTGRH